MDLERGKVMREDAIFRIYSMSKPITAVALMMLVEEGFLGLEDDVATYIPSWKDLGVYASGTPSLTSSASPLFTTTPLARPMKVVDLVTHTSGLTYGFMNRTSVDRAYRGLKVAEPDSETNLDTMIEQLSTLPLEFSPGTAGNYSVSIDVVGYLVQKLSGQSFGEFLSKRLFEPLGMTDTAFWCPPEKIDRFASCYMPGESGALRLQDDAAKSTYAEPPRLESGGGGLVSTAQDYMRFCRMMVNGGTLDGVQILSPKTVALFSVNFLPGNEELVQMAPPGMFSEAGYGGTGFSIGCGVTLDVARTRLAREHRNVVPGIVDRLVAPEAARMFRDHAFVLADDDAVGIGMDLDRTADRSRIHRMLVVVEADQAGLRDRGRQCIKAIEPTAVTDQLGPLLLEHIPDRPVRTVGTRMSAGLGDTFIEQPRSQFVIGLEPQSRREQTFAHKTDLAVAS